MNTLTHCIERPAATPRNLRNRLVAHFGSAAATWHLWRERSRSRAQLRELSDHLLRDIGISRSQADVEGSKPFWRA